MRYDFPQGPQSFLWEAQNEKKEKVGVTCPSTHNKFEKNCSGGDHLFHLCSTASITFIHSRT